MYWLWLFCLYSFLGYLLEKIFAAVTGARHQVRKCFLLLPLCPVYGLAMLAVLHLPADLTRGFLRLACGQCYRPALASGPGETLPWRQLLRQRYHQEVCAARQYDQAAQSVGDPCLAGLFRELSREEDCHARQLLGLLEQNILAF